MISQLLNHSNYLQASKRYGYINKEYISIGIRPFGENKSKAWKANAQSRQYHTIVEVRDS